MKVRQLEIFLSVMKTGSASSAAKLLNISQPAVSRAIGDLEQSIMFPLFDRVSNRLIPTPEARIFCKDVEESFRGFDFLRTRAAWIRDRGAGEIKVATLSSLSTQLVPRAIARFRTQHPQIRITLHVLWSRDVRDGVASGQFDLGLAADEIDRSGVHSEVFASRQVFCLLPAGHRLCDLDVITPTDLRDEPLITYVPEDRSRRAMDGIFAAAEIEPHYVIETIYTATICCLVSNGIGIGFADRYALGGMDASGVVLKPFKPEINTRVLLIRPQDRQKSQLVKDFIRCLHASRRLT